MPSFHLRKRLNRLRSSSSKSDHVKNDSAAESSNNVDPSQKGDHESSSIAEDTSQDLTGSTSSQIASSVTSTSTFSIRAKSQPTVTDPTGLTLVYSPDHGPIKADIIFVHGLGGTSRMTWSKDRNIRLFWPGEFLPLENELCQSRIFTFGYNADVKSGSKTSSSILTFAKDLLYDLNYALADETKGLRIGQVPLIFVAHSMGGLIVKEAYINGQYDPHCSHIIKAVLAIIFLSTPHRGSNLAETLNRILQVSPLSTPKPYINELVQNSFTIQKINEQFRHIAPKLNIISFYETLPTPMVRGGASVMVVEKDSSVLGYPGEVSKALEADHHTVCKYDSRQDPKYVAVCNYLKSKIGTVFSQQLRHTASKLSVSSSKTASTIPNLKSRELLDLFGLSEPCDADYIFFRDRWTPGTCNWILQEPSLVKWINGPTDSSSLLWIHGLPGSGKSILSSYVIDHLAQNGYACQYFFIRQGDSRKRSFSALLRSIAFQITQSDPLFLRAIARVSANLALRGADARTIWQRIFRSILFTQARSEPMFWVIDGFDECDDVRTGIKLLTEVLNLPASIKILVTSRWNPEIEGALKRLAPTHGEVLETITMQKNADDCQRFIELELDWSHIPEFQQRISEQLLLQAEGNFLWTRLTIDRINRCHTAAAVEQALHELHPGMEELYSQMAANLSHLNHADASLATSILSWVCCAQRRLSVLELAQALEPQSRDILDLQRSIVSLCSGFVVLDNDGSVATVHQTARDFLVKSKNKTFRVDRKQAHQTIALRCLKLLSTPGLRRKLRLGQAPVLLAYSSQYLWAHLASCDLLPENVVQAFIKFLKGQDVFTWIQSLAQDGQLHVMVQASEYMSICASRLNIPKPATDQQLLHTWATDLGKLVGKFGRQLLGQPESIHTTIAPFCPINSMIHRQLAHKGHQAINVTGIGKDWDDSVARLSFPTGYDALVVVAGGGIVAVAGMLDRIGRITVYRVDTHEEVQQFEHGERIRKIELDQFGTMLVSCGYSTTTVWSLETGDCISEARNPPTKPYPQTVVFDSDSKSVLIGTNDRRLWSVPISPVDGEDDEVETKYTQVTRIMEGKGGTNSPSCMALSPDIQLLACGYRQPDKGLTVWELESQEQIASRHDLTRATQLVWHPHTGELFGLLQILGGQIFKWYPDEDQEPLIQYSEASSLAISDNGSVLAVGDQYGTVRLMRTEDLVVIAQVAGQDPVLGLTFSSDCRQLYDLRRTHTNVWQPNVLLKLAEPTPELSDLDSDSDKTLVTSDRETPTASRESLHKTSQISGPTETPKSTPRVDPITTLAPRPVGTLYCKGTLGGVVTLHDANSPSKVGLELHRSTNSFSIQQITWSLDGSRVCYADVSRTIRVDSIGLGGTPPEATRFTKMTIHQLKDNITQVLFHSSAMDRLLVTSMAMGVVVNLAENTVDAVTPAVAPGSDSADDVPAIQPNNDGPGSLVQWISHPSSEELLMRVTDTDMEVFSWATLERRSSTAIRPQTYPEIPPGSPHHSRAKEAAIIPGSIRRSNTAASVAISSTRMTSLEALVSPEWRNTFYLLTFCHLDSTRPLSLRLWSLKPSDEDNEQTVTVPTPTMSEINVPPQLVNSILRPLGFINLQIVKSSGRDSTGPELLLVFLDRTSSVCTWPISRSEVSTEPSHTSSTIASNFFINSRSHNTTLGKQNETGKERATTNFRGPPAEGHQHQTAPPPMYQNRYSLPGDWISRDTVRLFHLFPRPNIRQPPLSDQNSHNKSSSSTGSARSTSMSNMLLACPTDGRVIIVGCNV
ncbi:hypothetical protein V8F06_014077 [Rhypophila decipiens]